jgi:hypothetical protein
LLNAVQTIMVLLPSAGGNDRPFRLLKTLAQLSHRDKRVGFLGVSRSIPKVRQGAEELDAR